MILQQLDLLRDDFHCRHVRIFRKLENENTYNYFCEKVNFTCVMVNGRELLYKLLLQKLITKRIFIRKKTDTLLFQKKPEQTVEAHMTKFRTCKGYKVERNLELMYNHFSGKLHIKSFSSNFPRLVVLKSK